MPEPPDWSAPLWGADFTGADLRHARLPAAFLDGVGVTTQPTGVGT